MSNQLTSTGDPTGAAGRSTINSDYAGDYNKAIQGGMTEQDFVNSQTFQDYQTKLANNYSGITDPNAISSELAYQQGRVNDPIYGKSAQALVGTLKQRQAALSNQPSQSTTPTSSGTSMAGVPAITNPYVSTGITSPNKGQDTSGNYTPQDQTVESRLPGLLSTDNPLIQNAEGGALLTAQSRGLENSTMAAQAGQVAAESVALPIAQQDATQTAQQNLSAQGAAQSGALQGQQISGTLTGTQMNIQASIQNLNTQIAANKDELAASLGSQANLQAAQLAMTKYLTGEQLTTQEDMLVKQLQGAMDQLKVSTTSQQGIAQMQLTGTQQGQVATMTAQFAGVYQDAINQINNNANLTPDARTAALKNAADNYTNNMQLVEQLFGVKITFSTTVPTSGTVQTPQVNFQ